MKKINLIQYLIIIIVVLVNTDCRKESPTRMSSNTNMPPPLVNTTAKASAGPDIVVELPANETLLLGSCSDQENNVRSHSWAKLIGPNSYIIENKESLITKVSNLEKGSYQFELTVTDLMGLYGRDTMAITVIDRLSTNTNEIIFENLSWIFPWYPSLEVENIYSYVSPTDSIKVFIKRDNSPGWVEVPFISSWPDYNYGPYEYFIETRPDGAGIYNYGSLYVFFYEYYGGGIGVTDTPDIKIVY